MQINKVILENYGLYAGKVEFDLAPRVKYRKKRPIILIGGKNGAGKTTILDALKLVLYGKAFLGSRVSQNEYESFLRQEMHKGNNTSSPIGFSKVAVEFDHVSMGKQSTYYVERSWSLKNGNGINEHLKILINGESKEDVTHDFWQGFIEELIPERLSQLFFFDGEKIKSIAEDVDGCRVLADAIKMLLGLDIVDRLKADLTIYSSRQLKKTSEKNSKETWQKIENSIKQLKEKIELSLEDLAHIRTKIDGNLADIRGKETQLHQEGQFFAEKRDSLKSERNHLSSKIEEYENQLQSECDKTYPFALCPSVCQLLKTLISKENMLNRQKIVRGEIKAIQVEILAKLAENEVIGKSLKEEVAQVVQSTVKSRLKTSAQLRGAKEVLGFSEATSLQVLAVLDDAEKRAAVSVFKLSRDFDKSVAKLRKVTKEMEKIPADAQVRPIFEELTLLNQRRGVLQQKESQVLEEIRRKENNLKELQRDLQKYIDQQVAHKTVKGQLALINNIQAVLDRYQEKLTQNKIDQLRRTVAQGYNDLSRKGKIVSNIEIDPKTFAVTLFDRSGEVIPQESLSSGEKQLYAVAMLWGLAKTAGRPLPIIIDTPLGRLDSDHRRNLVNNYFPKASHQVILLSTDTEVDQQLYKDLSPNISHCYNLKFNQKTQSTKPCEEYFWKESRACLN